MRHNEPFVGWSDATWRDLNRMAGVPLNEDQREAIRAAVEDYQRDVEFAASASAVRHLMGRRSSGKERVSTPITRFASAAERLVNAWRDIQAAPDAQHYLDAASPGVNLESTIGNVESVSLSLEIRRLRLAPKVRLLRRLAKAFKDAGGVVTTSMPVDGTKESADWHLSRKGFVPFSQGVLALLGVPGQSPAAATQEVRRALGKRGE